jgi:hypothetical protein
MDPQIPNRLIWARFAWQMSAHPLITQTARCALSVPYKGYAIFVLEHLLNPEKFNKIRKTDIRNFHRNFSVRVT